MNSIKRQKDTVSFKLFTKDKFTKPVISYGLLAFTLDYDQDYNPQTQKILKKESKNKKEARVLLVQRRNTMGYNDFIRGRYFFNDNEKIAKQYLTEMTQEERHKIETMDFDSLWDDLWFNHSSKHFKNDKKKSKHKYVKLDIKKLLACTSSKYSYAEFGIPKGRRNGKETEIQCAQREFEEETGYTKDDYDFLDIEPIEENFTGTNNIEYKHVYYYVLMKKKFTFPALDKFNFKQCEEIQNLDFFYLEDALKVLRDYDKEKKKILISAFEKICQI